MKLSIIVPFHKGTHFLEDCFESIKDQGLSDYETILVLDHVKEDVSGLIDAYRDKLNIKILEITEPCGKNRKYGSKEVEEQFASYSGVACARNKGLAAAAGEFVYFLDSDDFILSETLLLLLKEAQEQDADLVYGKRKSTWFKRKVFLASIETDNSEEDPEEFEQEEDEKIVSNTILRQQKKLAKVKDVLAQYDPNASEEYLFQKADAYHSLIVSKKGLKSISVLGILFRKSFIEEHRMSFNEDFIFYSDLSFMVKAMHNVNISAYVEEAVYVKRKHNDPIHYPALSQSKTEDKFEEYLRAYEEAVASVPKKSAAVQYLNQKLILYFCNTFAPNLRRSVKAVWSTNRFQAMQRLVKDMDVERVKALRGYKKRIIKALIAGNAKKATRIITLHLGLKKMKKIRKNRRVFAYYLYFKFFLKMPIKENWVICETFFGKSYSDSPKYIYEYLCKNYPGKYKFIWVINKHTQIPFNPIKVKRFSIRYAYYLARCKYNIFNVRQPEWMRKREGNVFLETWHGTPLKKLVFDQEEVMGASPLYKAQFYHQSRIWDYLVSANHFSTKAFQSAFLYDKEILEFGYPRNDILYHEKKDELSAQLKKKIGIPEGKKTILYAPTWRDDEYYGRGEYKFALKLDLRLLKKELGDDYVVLLRTHYFIADSLDVTGLEDFAINVSKYDDISELYLVSDMLITDYSSVFFDYANLKRPILFYTYDLEKYRDMLRGFYMDIENDVPGPLVFTNEEVVEAIKNIDDITEEYKEKYDIFYERFCSLEDGHASENVAKRVFQL
ncbi:MAG: hypothetical protein K0S47_2353 [Herbinix sp.]|nr:hypothetical protein [Herbinix sp.]